MTAGETSSLLEYQRKLQKIIIQHQRPFLEREEKLSAEEATHEVYTVFREELSKRFRELVPDFPVHIASFRSRRGVSETFLRTLHSDPHGVAAIFNHPDDAASFEFNRVSFDGPFTDGPIEYSDNQLEYDCLIKAYAMGVCKKSEDADEQGRFPHRVRSFIEKEELANVVQEEFSSGTLEKIKSGGTCVVFGRLRKQREPGDRLDDLVALYSSKKLGTLDGETGEIICRVISITLTAFSQIERFDKEEFRRSAMTRVTELVPDFSDKLKAPATNVSLLINGLTQSFANHPYFGTSTQPGDVTVRFVKLDFTRELEVDGKVNGSSARETLLPKLSIYPPAYANLVSENATYFSHRASKSVVKYLLGKWGRLNKWKVGNKPYRITEAFKKTFDPSFDSEVVNDPKVGPIWWPFINGARRKQVSGIYANRLKDPEFWKRHNFTATNADRPVVTTAAFLLNQAQRSEKSIKDGLELPFGILAFESKVPDAFSREDLRILEEISEAVAHLVDLNGWSEVHVDYSTRIQDAILKARFGDKLDARSHIAFHLQRVDVKALKRWVEGGGAPRNLPKKMFEGSDLWNSIWGRGYRGMVDVFRDSDGHDEADFREVLENLRQFYKNYHKPPVRAKNAQHKWKRDPLEIMAEDESIFPSGGVHEKQTLAFLESIPSSEEWHARFSAIPRALLTRELTNPTFTNFPTGFSADAIYVLDDVNEIRQILKFSDRESIKKERENYQTFVRYHTPLAARMPADGFAVDSNGTINPTNSSDRAKVMAEEKRGYGVLVSDLVAGTKEAFKSRNGQKDDGVPHSLQEFLYTFYSNGPFKDENDKINQDYRKDKLEQFLQAITHHFRSKATKWENPRERSFGEKFEAWLESEVEFDLEKIILDSSRLEQLIDAQDGRTEKFFDPAKPFGDGVKSCENAEPIVHTFFKHCSGAFSASIDQFEDFHELVTKAFDYDKGLTLSDRDCYLSKATSLSALLTIARSRSLEHLDVISQNEVEPLLSVIHGDSHGRNLTWSDAFKQFQMIDFENVRFGYAYSDQIKLMVSVMSQLLSSHLSEPRTKESLEKGLSADFEEAIIALTCFVRAFRKKDASFGETLDQSFFRRPFRVTMIDDLQKIKDMRDSGRHTEQEVDEAVDEYRKSNHASGDLTRMLRRIFGSSFDLPDVKSVATHDLNTIRVSNLSDVYRGAEERAFRIAFSGALKAFALKEFSYHLRALTDRDLKRLKIWNELLSGIGSVVDISNFIVKLEAEWELTDAEMTALRKYARERMEEFSKLAKSGNPNEEISEVELNNSFLKLRVQDICKLVISLFPRSDVSTVQADERVASLASACFVLLSVNMYTVRSGGE